MTVARWVDWLSGHVERHPRFWTRLAGLETRMVEDRIEDIVVDRPVYVTGLARSGTTILLELLSRHPDVATHRYRDFPPVMVPWMWNGFLDRASKGSHVAEERAHGDRIWVTPESPEAFEEVLWMTFFPRAHESSESAVLNGETRHPDFERFYRDHIRKLLAVRGGTRYVAKGNYNLTRLSYLEAIAPDARFVLPIRNPVDHVASLMRQHERFSAEGQRDERIRRHMRRSGHYEFGLDRRPIHTGDGEAVEQVRALWREGREVEGWARYWALVYGHVGETLERHATVGAASLVVRYEDLCANPAGVMEGVLDHCGLSAEDLPRLASETIRAPDYYRAPFDDHDIDLIRRATEGVAASFGYD